jgi:tRNA dimethylallyltransferase
MVFIALPGGLAARLFFLYRSLMRKEKVVVVVGPTASGKSSYAVKLARKIGGEVISADSRQVYTGLDIGTGKITAAEMRGVPHHLLDVVSPKKVFTAQDFVERGRAAIEDIVKRGKTPIICGGTGFYIDALLGRVPLPNVPPDHKLRERLATKSAPQLFAMLQKLDRRRAKNIDRHNPVRLIRAIEIAKKLGKVPVAKPQSLPYAVEWIGLNPGEKKLRANIHKRLHARMKAGMVREARKLHNSGLSWKRMQELGLEYRYLALYLQKKISKDAMLTQLENRIYDYSRRQKMYWKRNPDIRWRKS